MIRANRRRRLLFLSLAAMDVAVSLPYVQVMLARWSWLGENGAWSAMRWRGPILMFALFWLATIAYMTAADWVNRKSYVTPLRELVIMATVVVTSVVAAGAILAATGAIALQHSFRDLLAPAQDWSLGLILLGYNMFLWWRVASFTSRDLTFFSVGVSFRLGLLISLVGNSLLTVAGGSGVIPALIYLWLFFSTGLLATALARVDDKAYVADHSTGALLPWSRFGRMVVGVCATIGVAALASVIWSQAGFGRLSALLAPVGRVLGQVVALGVGLLIWLLTPALLALERLMLRARGAPVPPPPEPELAQPWLTQADNGLLRAVGNSLALRTLLLVLGLAIVLGLIWLFFERTARKAVRDENEDVESAPPELGTSPGKGRRLGSWFGLARRYGLGTRLLAAISVQNLYANVTRLARSKGSPRLPSQPPDEYLAVLQRTFAGHDEMLRRLTLAYMRVHYGDQPVDRDELAQLRADFERLRTEVG